ncbi:MAG: 2-amino-4-hydroxy-6-hydroxymethyldihydropteridine diphosphokinase [Oceanococcus sp.]
MLSWIGLGSNLGDSSVLLQAAVADLACLPASELIAVSPFYRSKALQSATETQAQPDYCNAVAALQTDLAPQVLLDALLRIERQHGRDRRDERRWQSRSLDLDLLVVGDQHQQTATLSLPHPELHKRDFVLQPWSDLASGMSINDQGMLAECLHRLESAPLQSWARTIPLS